MGWIEWAAGLVFFDILMIILVTGAGSSGLDITNNVVAYDKTSPAYNYSTEALTTDVHWFDNFWIGFSSMPWWIDIFLITYQVVLIAVILLAWARGVS